MFSVAAKSFVSSKMRISNYVNIIKDNLDQVIIYHSLFGNIHSIPSNALQLLSSFQNPIHAEEFNDRFNQAEIELIEKLVSLYFIVPENFDERAITEVELKRRFDKLETGELINAVQLNVSEGCNLKCTYCFADRVDERASASNFEARNSSKTMSFDVAKVALESVKNIIKANHKNSLVIKFFGREPMLNWKVINEVINYCQEDVLDFHYFFTVTTNGTLFNSENVKKLSQVNAAIIVSLDGFSTGNKLRIMQNGSGTFDKVDKGLDILKENGISSCVATVLTDWNFDTLGKEFIDYLKSKSVSQWEIKIGMQNGNVIQRDSKQYADKLFELYKLGKEKNILVTGDWYDPFVTLFHTTKFKDDDFIHKESPHTCSATDHQISVEPSGKVFGCRALDTQLGDTNNLKTLLSSNIYKSLAMRTYYNVPSCQGCKLEGFCQGVCLGHSEKLFGDIYTPDQSYCDIYRNTFDLLLTDYLKTNF